MEEHQMKRRTETCIATMLQLSENAERAFNIKASTPIVLSLAEYARHDIDLSDEEHDYLMSQLSDVMGG